MVGFGLIGVLILAGGVACGGKKKVALTADQKMLASACGPAPAAMAGQPTLPPSFPSPSEVIYTGVKTAGPTTIISGYWKSDLNTADNVYKSAMQSAAGYKITKAEHDIADAEVAFTGHAKSGQVKLSQRCKGRTLVAVTIRPA
jgi:hypothetical protein